MQNLIVLTFFLIALPFSVNNVFNDDDRAFTLVKTFSQSRGITSFFESYEFSTREILVDENYAITPQPINTVVNEKKPQSKLLMSRTSNNFGKFAEYKSSFGEMENYWPTKAHNPIAKEKVKLEKVVKLEIPKPVVVQKINVNKEAIAEIDRKFELAFANENDFINTTHIVEGKEITVKVSLLTTEIRNYIGDGEIIKTSPLPRLAVENFKKDKLQERLAFLDEDANLDKLITDYKRDKVKLRQGGVKKTISDRNDNDMVFVDLQNENRVSAKVIERKTGPIEPNNSAKQRKTNVQFRPKKLAENRVNKTRQLAAKLALDKLLSSQNIPNEPQASPTRIGAPAIISKSVTNAITRSLKKVASQRSSLLASRGKKIVAGPKEFSSFLQSNILTEAVPSHKSSTTKPFVTMSPLLIDLDSKNKPKSLHEFDIIPSYNLNDVLTDAGSGKIKVEYPLVTEKGLFHGSLVHRDTVRVNFDIPIGSEENEYSIPAFDLSQFNDFLNTNKVSVPGGFLLVEYSEGIESVDIERYQHVLHLNGKFQIIDDQHKPEYSLFVGVEAGNILLRALNKKGAISEKVLFIYDDELTFTTTQYEIQKNLKFNLYKESLLGKKSVFSVESDNISYFNLPIKAKRQTVNGYSLKAPPLMEGMRRYLEVKTDSGVFIIGTDKGGDLSVPTEKTLDFYLGEVNLSDFENSCIVQLNTNKPIDSMQVDGITKRGPMLLDSYYLNDDGQLYKNIDGVVRKIFITGDYQGTIYFNLKYVDGTEEVAKTYCSPGTYVIENF